MKTSNKQGSRKSARHLQTGAFAGCAIFLASSAAFAQDQAEPTEEVVVTGIRKSIQDSIGVKKNESSIVEVVSAEDIGKLPDSSIAESIARLPGIAAQRTNGRAQTLSIRGLGVPGVPAALKQQIRGEYVCNRIAKQVIQPTSLRSGFPGLRESRAARPDNN